MARTAARLCVVLMCFVLVACGRGGQTVEIDYNDPLAAKLGDLVDTGGSAELNTLTDFGWDEVHLFHEGASREVIEKAVGAPVIRGKYFESAASLLVFEEHGEVVRAIGVTGDYLRGQGEDAASGEPRFDFPADVILERWGNGALQLRMPPT